MAEHDAVYRMALEPAPHLGVMASESWQSMPAKPCSRWLRANQATSFKPIQRLASTSAAKAAARRQAPVEDAAVAAAAAMQAKQLAQANVVGQQENHAVNAQSDVSRRENVAVVLVAKLINSNAVSTSSQLEVTRRASVNRLRLR